MVLKGRGHFLAVIRVDVTTEDWSERCNINGFAVQKRGCKQSNVGSLEKPEKARKWISRRASRKNIALPTP